MKKISEYLKVFYKKYILRNDIIFYSLIFIFSIVAYIYLRFVIITSRISYDFAVNKKKLKKNTYILAFWHGRLLSAFFARKYFAKAYVLISYSKGAYLVKLVANYFRTSVVRGSKNKGGSESLRHILKILKQKETVFAIAPDGSIGPLLRCSAGVATMALLSKREILPITFSAKRNIFLKSWDKFCIPLPFNKISLHLASPINPINENGSKKDSEDLRKEIEHKLQNLMWDVDEKYGIAKIIPSNKDKKGKNLKVKTKDVSNKEKKIS